MSSSTSSPVSPSSDPGTYISILANIKRKAINCGARPQDFNNHLHSVLLIVNSALYNGYTEADKAWHIDLFMWEHFFTEPFPFLSDVDLHPNGNSTTTIIRNLTLPRPADIIFLSPPRVPLPQTPVRDPRNRFRGLAPEEGLYVPGMVMGYLPPVWGNLSGGEVLEWQRGVVDGQQERETNGEKDQGTNGELSAQSLTPGMNDETLSSAGTHRHHRKRLPHRRDSVGCSETVDFLGR